MMKRFGPLIQKESENVEKNTGLITNNLDYQKLKKYFSGSYSEKTLKDYYFYFKNFLSFISSQFGVNNMPDINENHILAYLSHLKNERELQNSSINKILSSIKFFFKRMDNIKDPTRNVPKLKNDSYDPADILTLTQQDIKTMVNSIEVDTMKDLRNRLMLRTLYYTGLRSGELRNLRYQDLVDIQGNKKIKLTKTKSQKTEYVPLNPKLIDDIQEYKQTVKISYNFEKMHNKYLFPSYYLKNKPLTNQGLNNIIKKISQKSIGKKITAHTFRHAIITILLLQGVDLDRVSDFARHSSLRITKHYDDAVELKKASTVQEIPDL